MIRLSEIAYKSLICRKSVYNCRLLAHFIRLSGMLLCCQRCKSFDGSRGECLSGLGVDKVHAAFERNNLVKIHFAFVTGQARHRGLPNNQMLATDQIAYLAGTGILLILCLLHSASLAVVSQKHFCAVIKCTQPLAHGLPNV